MQNHDERLDLRHVLILMPLFLCPSIVVFFSNHSQRKNIHFKNVMRIGIIGSMQFTDKMLEVREKLREFGHDAFITDLHKSMIGKDDLEIEKIKLHQKHNMDAIREFWRMMQNADAVLILNYNKNGIKNYIGGNTLMEIGFAHVLNQKIFMLNPIPEIPYYKSEIEAVKPIIINGDLTKIK